jgi:hypothetical protein
MGFTKNKIKRIMIDELNGIIKKDYPARIEHSVVDLFCDNYQNFSDIKTPIDMRKLIQQVTEHMYGNCILYKRHRIISDDFYNAIAFLSNIDVATVKDRLDK